MALEELLLQGAQLLAGLFVLFTLALCLFKLKRSASQEPTLCAGTEVKTADGRTGTITSLQGNHVILQLPDGQFTPVPRQAIISLRQRLPTMSKYFSLFSLVALIFGIILANIVPPSYFLLASCLLALGCTAGTALFLRNQPTLLAWGLSAALCGGFAAWQAQELTFINRRTSLEGKAIAIHGTIIEKTALAAGRNKELILVKASHIVDSSTGTPLNFTGTIGLYLGQKTDLQVGDHATTAAIKTKQSSATDQDYVRYLKKERLLATFFIDTDKVTCTARPAWSLRRTLASRRDQIYKNLAAKLPPKARSYVGLMFFGNKAQPDYAELRTTFGCWGLSHFLARSGLHLVIFFAIWGLLLQFLPIHRRWKLLLLTLILGCYTTLSWSSISFARALLLLFILSWGSIFKRQTLSLHLLSLICGAILLYNPAQLFFLDFQLTFLLTFGLLLFFQK